MRGLSLLRVREDYRELASYLTGRLLLEDTLWKALFRFRQPTIIRDLAVSCSVAGKQVPVDKLGRLLHQCSRRFQLEEQGKWGLTIWHIPPKHPLVAKAEVILDLSGLPLKTDDLAALLQQCHYPKHATPDIVTRILESQGNQSTFVKLEEYWTLARWVHWKHSQGEESLLDQMVEVDSQVLSLRSLRPVEGYVKLLRSAGVALSTGYLFWALEQGGVNPSPSLLLKDDRILPVCGGHWVLQELVPQLLAKFGIDQWEAMELQLKQISHEADLKRLERELRQEIHRVKHEAASVLSRQPLSCEELDGQVGLNRWIETATSIEVEQAKLLTIAHSELIRLTDEGDLVRLPSGRLLKLSKERVREVVKHLTQSLCGLKAHEILGGLLQFTVESDDDQTIILEALEERLRQCNELEVTGGHWHLSRQLLRETLSTKVIKALIESLESCPAPVPPAELIQSLFDLSSPPKGIMESILMEVIEERLAHEARLWRLDSGYWWVQPEYLVTPDRLQKVKEYVAEHPGASFGELTTHACGLQLEELNVRKKAQIMHAFSEKIGEATSGQRSSRGSPPVVPRVHIPPPKLVPPKRARITLTREAIWEGRIPITPGLKQMLSAYGLHGLIELATYGTYRLRVWINPTEGVLRGEDIAHWFQENNVQAGDIVYVCAPDQQGEALRLYTAFEIERRTRSEQEPIEPKQRIYFREQLYQILRENKKVTGIEELCEALKERVRVHIRRASVEVTLSRESHVFVLWGGGNWGLREWGEDWRNRVDKEALLMRISEEDLVVEILRDFGQQMSGREIAHEIARQFLVTADFVLETTFLDSSDARLVRHGEFWGLREWMRRSITSWFFPLRTRPEFKLLVNDWLQQRWELGLDKLPLELGIAQGSWHRS